MHDDNGSAVLHTATIPAGAMTFAEFFTFEGGLIASLNLQWNGPEYIEKEQPMTAKQDLVSRVRQALQDRHPREVSMFGATAGSASTRLH